MWVATTQRHLKDEYGNYRDELECSYTEYFDRHGMVLVPVSNSLSEPERVLEVAPDGVVLTGGDEVDPSLYGGETRDDYAVSPDRDETERRLLDAALQSGVPVLGVCRGLQAINVFFGGALEDVNAEETTHPPNEDHGVTVTSARLADELGTETATVNSYHDQAVTTETVASELEAFAVHDGIVEGLYHPDHRLAAVQWHPERDNETRIDRLLVEAFEEASLFWAETDEV